MEAAEKAMGEARAAASTKDARWMGRIQSMGVWLSELPSKVNGMELGAQEWRDSLLLHYGIYPHDLLDHCDGCGSALSISHAISRITTSSVMGLPTLQVSNSPLRMCVTIPKFSQVDPCMEGRANPGTSRGFCIGKRQHQYSRHICREYCPPTVLQVS